MRIYLGLLLGSAGPRVLPSHAFAAAAGRGRALCWAPPNLDRGPTRGLLPKPPKTRPSYRTSSSLWLNRSQDAVVTAIERRVELASRLPLEHQEPFEVLRYAKGEKNLDHFDFL